MLTTRQCAHHNRVQHAGFFMHMLLFEVWTILHFHKRDSTGVLHDGHTVPLALGALRNDFAEENRLRTNLGKNV